LILRWEESALATVLTANAEAVAALKEGVEALRLLAEYELPPRLRRRMHELGENKEFLGPEQHAELMELAEFAQGLTLEKLKAMGALKRLRVTVPSLFEQP
jgi:hypothetical protein